MEAIRIISELWQFILSILGLVVWLVRLEGKSNVLERDHSMLLVKHDALDSSLVKELSKVREALARIEGRLSAVSHMGETN